MKKWLLMSLLLLSSLSQAAIELGKDYTILAKPQPVANAKKIEVIEFFSYSCGHCYNLAPFMNAWEKAKPADVEVRKEQVVWNKPMEGLARMFAALQTSPAYEQLHMAAFDAVMKSNRKLEDEATFSSWIKQQKGADAAKIMAAYKSFGANAKVARAGKMVRDYAIEGTPALVVNGKYMIKPATPQRLLQVLDELIVKVRSEKK